MNKLYFALMTICLAAAGSTAFAANASSDGAMNGGAMKMEQPADHMSQKTMDKGSTDGAMMKKGTMEKGRMMKKDHKGKGKMQNKMDDQGTMQRMN